MSVENFLRDALRGVEIRQALPQRAPVRPMQCRRLTFDVSVSCDANGDVLLTAALPGYAQLGMSFVTGKAFVRVTGLGMDNAAGVGNLEVVGSDFGRYAGRLPNKFMGAATPEMKAALHGEILVHLPVWIRDNRQFIDEAVTTHRAFLADRTLAEAEWLAEIAERLSAKSETLRMRAEEMAGKRMHPNLDDADHARHGLNP
jgi:hypothetical protein